MRSGLFLLCVMALVMGAFGVGYGLNAATRSKVMSTRPASLSLEGTRQAFDGLEKLIGFGADEALRQEAIDFFALPSPEGMSLALRAELLEQKNVAAWAGAVEEFVGLAALVFEDAPNHEANQKEFDRYVKTLEALRVAINTYVLAIHPGFHSLEIDKISQSFEGRGITIAVFDVFDSEILIKQRLAFPKSHIEAPMTLGRPVSLTHGNVVIDTILRIAPQAHIVPVWADAKDYTLALQYIVDRKDIEIVNMSRAFAEGHDKKHLDPEFKKLLKILVKDRILCKALGNTGTDLTGVVTAKRLALGLGPVNNLASYDINLIADTYSGDSAMEADDLLVFALNLSLFADDIAWSATIPGAMANVQSRTLAVPAEGVWSPSLEAFDSGSSFAAPQIAALSALLLEAEKLTSSSALDQKRKVLEVLKASAARGVHGAEDWGLGLPSGDVAAGLLIPKL